MKLYTRIPADIAEAQSRFRDAVTQHDWEEAAWVLTFYTRTAPEETAVYPPEDWLADSDEDTLLTTDLIDLAREYDARCMEEE